MEGTAFEWKTFLYVKRGKKVAHYDDSTTTIVSFFTSFENNKK